MNGSPAVARELISKLQSSSAAGREPASRNAAASSDVDLLVSSSTPVQLQLGTGADIYTTSLIPAILAAQSEIILVTCFWAKSKTLSALCDALATLASERQALIDRGASVQPLHIHICFSSRSLLQKLFHTSSDLGYTYPPSSWPKTLGLPPSRVLEAGHIKVQVKTLFFLPFSVMHPKFLIVDRQRAFIPSCNVSWETWLEGNIEITGAAVGGLLQFFARTWNKDLGELPTLPPKSPSPATYPSPQEPILSSTRVYHRFPAAFPPIPTVILPSCHHRNPNFRPFPWQTAAPPPPTPLNVALLHLIDNSTQSIYIQTPNFTSPPVISALLDALGRGVRVTIVTSRNMMLLEQLLTAGTTTSWCLRSFLRRYKSMIHERDRQRYGVVESDPEAQRSPLPGQLHISYFQPGRASKYTATERYRSPPVALEEPLHSHFKLTVVDGEHTVLGSGNMDRASWYTSQELGILFQSRDFAATTMDAVSQALHGRLSVVFEGGPLM